jgi:hypothetical protein
VGGYRDMPHLLVICLVPTVPLACLALVLWLDRLEETLDREVDRRRKQVSAPQTQLETSLAGVSASSVAVTGPEVSLGGSTKR